MPRWAADGVREGMNGLTAALDSLVRCSESGIPAPGGPAFLLKGALRHLVSPLASFAAALGDGLGGIFWAALPPASSAFQQATRLSPVIKDVSPPALRSSASVPFSVPGGVPLAASLASQPSATVPSGSRFTSSSGIAAHPLFVRDLFLETLPASRALPATGRRVRQRAVCWTAAILFAVTAGVALYRGGERSQTLLPDMIRFEEHLPRAASIAELDGPDRPSSTNWNAAVPGPSGSTAPPKNGSNGSAPHSANASPHPCRNPVIPTAGSTIS